MSSRRGKNVSRALDNLLSEPPQKKRRRQSQSFGKQIGAVGTLVPEKKNSESTGTATGTGAGLWSLPNFITPIAQGSSSITRVGRRTVVTSILVRWYLNSGATATAMRWCLIYDHSPNLALPAVLDIFQRNGINTPMSLTNSDRFYVLHDEIVNIPGSVLEVAGKLYWKKRSSNNYGLMQLQAQSLISLQELFM